MTQITIDKAELQGKDQKITEQQQENERLRQQLAEAQSSPSGQSTTSGSSDLSREDQETLGDLYSPMKKLVEASLGGVVSGLNKNFEGINTSIESLKSNIETSNRGLFSGVTRSAIANYDEIINTQECKDFMETEIDGVGIKWKDALADAESKNDLNRMKVILSKVPMKDNGEGSSSATSQASANFEPTGGTSSSETQFGVTAKHSVLEKQAVDKAYNSGELPQEEFDKYTASFEDALVKGEVVDDRPKDQQDK